MELIKFFFKDEVPAVGLTKFKDKRVETFSMLIDIAKELELKDRIYICPSCGTIIDRDLNASRNILEEGLKSI